MPVIEPTSIQDCIDFINNNEKEILDAVYDLKIRKQWIPELPEETKQFLLSHCNSSKVVIGEHIQKTKEAGNILTQLANDVEANVRIVAAQNQNTPPKILEQLASDYADQVRLAVARNPAVPISLMLQLSQDKKSEIRHAVSTNPAISLPIINRLSLDRSQSIRNTIENKASDVTTPTQLLETLSKCNNPVIRARVAENPKLPRKLLNILRRDNDTMVRKATDRALLRIARSPSASPADLMALVEHPLEEIRIAVASNPNLAVAILENMVRGPSVPVRLSVAKQRKAPLSVLQILAKDTHLPVRIELARNHNLPEPVLILLSQDPAQKVKEILAHNPAEATRRKQPGLCGICGKSLGKIESVMGVNCFSCRGRNIFG